jgi:hypothetical protein
MQEKVCLLSFITHLLDYEQVGYHSRPDEENPAALSGQLSGNQ